MAPGTAISTTLPQAPAPTLILVSRTLESMNGCSSGLSRRKSAMFRCFLSFSERKVGACPLKTKQLRRLAHSRFRS